MSEAHDCELITQAVMRAYNDTFPEIKRVDNILKMEFNDKEFTETLHKQSKLQDVKEYLCNKLRSINCTDKFTIKHGIATFERYSNPHVGPGITENDQLRIKEITLDTRTGFFRLFTDNGTFAGVVSTVTLDRLPAMLQKDTTLEPVGPQNAVLTYQRAASSKGARKCAMIVVCNKLRF